jgi:hypothetical protein
LATRSALPGRRGRERRPLLSRASTRTKMPPLSCSATFATFLMATASIACRAKRSSTASTVPMMPCGRNGVASAAISSPASSRRVNWRRCWSRFKYGRGPSGRSPRPPENRRQKDTTVTSLTRHGGHTAKAASRHNHEISGTCGGCKASHGSRFRAPRLPPLAVPNEKPMKRCQPAGHQRQPGGVPLTDSSRQGMLDVSHYQP